MEDGRRRSRVDAVTVGHDEEPSTEMIELVGLGLAEHRVQGLAASSRGAGQSPVHQDDATQSSELAVVDAQTAATQRRRHRPVPPSRTSSAQSISCRVLWGRLRPFRR